MGYFHGVIGGNMGGVSIEESGLGFVWVCLQKYWGTCLLPALFLAGILWSLLRHRNREAGIFLFYTIFLLLTAYNPLLVNYIVPKVNFENEYYRFFWMLPVVPGVAYYTVRLIFYAKKLWKRVVLGLVSAGVMIMVGVPLQGVVENFAMIENVYKVPDDLRTICELIHQDSDKKEPRVVFDRDLNTMARQYDPSLRLVLHRDAVLYRAGSTITARMNEDSPWYQRQKIIMDLLYYGEPVKLETFRNALIQTETEYLAVPKEKADESYLEEAGCVLLARTENYILYRFQETEEEPS